MSIFNLGPQQGETLKNAIFDLYESYGIDTGAHIEIDHAAQVWPEFKELKPFIQDIFWGTCSDTS